MLRRFLLFSAALIFMVMPALAQADSAVARSSWLYEVWTVIAPIVVTVGTPLFAVLASWLAVKLSSLLSKNDEVARLKIEGEIRNAIHQAAANGLKYAIAGHTGKIGDMITGVVPTEILDAAVEYVRSKNPDVAKKVDDDNLKQIILSKVVDVQAALGAAAAAKLPAAK